MERAAPIVWLLAGSLVALAGCKTSKTEIALTLRAESAMYRPEYMTMHWRGPGGRNLDQRVPVTAFADNLLLATVVVELDDSASGERVVFVRGMKTVMGAPTVVSGAGVRVPWRAYERHEVVVSLHAWLDGNMNEYPDELECSPPPCAPPDDAGAGQDAGAGDAGIEDATGDASTEEADAEAEAGSNVGSDAGTDAARDMRGG